MQFLKTLTVLGVTLATAVQAAPAAWGPPGGFSFPGGQQTTNAATAAPATQTQVKPATTVATQATTQATQDTPAETTKKHQGTQGTQATGVSSPSKTGSTSQPSGSSSAGSGGSGVTVINSCSETIYVTVSHDGSDGSAQAVPAGGSPHFGLSGSDMNLKVGPQTSTGANIAQVEYSVTSSYISWDLSLINGNPFKAQGTSLVPSGGSGSECIPVHCTPGEATCPNAYNSNADNSKSVQPTLTCSLGTSLTFTACSG